MLGHIVGPLDLAVCCLVTICESLDQLGIIYRMFLAKCASYCVLPSSWADTKSQPHQQRRRAKKNTYSKLRRENAPPNRRRTALRNFLGVAAMPCARGPTDVAVGMHVGSLSGGAPHCRLLWCECTTTRMDALSAWEGKASVWEVDRKACGNVNSQSDPLWGTRPSPRCVEGMDQHHTRARKRLQLTEPVARLRRPIGCKE